jgi:hypothetical protein
MEVGPILTMRRLLTMHRVLLSVTLFGALTGPLAADVTVVEDDFNVYSDDFDLWLKWEPATGGGVVPPPLEVQDAGILTTDAAMFPGIEGKAVAHVGGAVNQWFPLPDFFDPVNQDNILEPTEDQSIAFGGDIFLSSSNSRLSVGLRSNAPANILEIGAWNTDARTFAYRLNSFESGDVDWQFFDLPPTLDTNADGTVTPGDLGPAWHRFQATVTPADVTFELDVFRDGTVDATAVVPATPSSAMFDSLRIGGPSGLTSAAEGAFDNIFLRLEDGMPDGGGVIPGDYNNNGRVEQGDLDLVLLNWGTDGTTPPPNWINHLPQGNIDQAELDGVLLNWGNTADQLAGAAAVPEPAAILLVWAAGAALGAARSLRRRPRP